ncbi:MAG: hypothetical protein QM535_17230 [Limnohabitans sp.]|nr:hypothetical protein [Limnohabitans sp.]
MAIFKVKITNDYEQEQNKLKKGMEVEVFTGLPTATIYGGAEIKKSLERKYSIQVNGTGWNTETTLNIEKLDENNLTNLELELQYIKSEKEKIVKAQLFDEFGNIRDYEKEILHKMRNLKTTNKMDKETYTSINNEIIENIKSTHRWQEDEGFIADGIINFDKYINSPIKTMVILAESYGYHTCEVTSIELQNEKDILGIENSSVKTPRAISALLWFLFESIKNNRKVEQEEFHDWKKVNKENSKILNNILTSISYINVKKASKDTDENESTRLSYNEIVEAVTRNRVVLEKQIQTINPELIIVASEAVKNGVVDTKLLGEGIESSEWYKIYRNTKGQKVFFVKHPSYLTDWSYDETYETFEILFNEFNTNK